LSFHDWLTSSFTINNCLSLLLFFLLLCFLFSFQPFLPMPSIYNCYYLFLLGNLYNVLILSFCLTIPSYKYNISCSRDCRDLCISASLQILQTCKPDSGRQIIQYYSTYCTTTYCIYYCVR
jgi:hypothetical protein